mgnify:FL=1
MTDYLAELNQAQREAVLHKEGPLLIVAGAGAGKTKTLTHRILHLVRQGVEPRSILAITFTNKAAGELRERLQKLLASDDLPFASTFHSFGVFVLRNEAERLGLKKNFSIFDRDESLKTIKEGIKSLGLDPKTLEPRKVLNTISRAKSAGQNRNSFLESTTSNSFFQKTVGQVWQKYNEGLREAGALDFDDLLAETVRLFRERPEILGEYQKRFRYIHIDEYQDTNTIQYDLARLLAAAHRNVCVVGDVDQSIYSWRGADFENLLRFEEDYPEARVVTLEENYRSTQNILAAANAIIKKNTKRKEKNLFTKNGAGEKIDLLAGFDEADEAGQIAGKIANLLTQRVKPEEVAILYRANFQSRALEEGLLRAGIAYQVLGTRFFEREEIKDMIAFLRATLNREDLFSLKRVINIPPRGIGKVTLAKIFSGNTNQLPASTQAKWQSFQTLLNEIKQMTEIMGASEVIKFVLEKSGWQKLLQTGGDDDKERLENLRELVTLAKKYDGLTGANSTQALLDEAALVTDQDTLNEKKAGVKMMTVHAAKGLEFNHVFVTGLEQNLFPHVFMGVSDEARDEEEERRLFYVAITRAKEKLYLSYAETRTIFGGRQVNLPSEFIFDIEPELFANSLPTPLRDSVIMF